MFCFGSPPDATMRRPVIIFVSGLNIPRRSEKLNSQPCHRFWRFFHHELHIFFWFDRYLSRFLVLTISRDMAKSKTPPLFSQELHYLWGHVRYQMKATLFLSHSCCFIFFWKFRKLRNFTFEKRSHFFWNFFLRFFKCMSLHPYACKWVYLRICDNRDL